MIDLINIRGYMRGKLITAALIPTADYAWEGRYFDPASKDIYIAEIIQPDNDSKAATTVYGSQVTFTYNVYSRSGDSAGRVNTEESHNLVLSIAEVFSSDHPTTLLTGEVVTVQEIRRRVATENDGWRLSPIDIIMRIEQSI